MSLLIDQERNCGGTTPTAGLRRIDLRRWRFCRLARLDDSVGGRDLRLRLPSAQLAPVIGLFRLLRSRVSGQSDDLKRLSSVVNHRWPHWRRSGASTGASFQILVANLQANIDIPLSSLRSPEGSTSTPGLAPPPLNKAYSITCTDLTFATWKIVLFTIRSKRRHKALSTTDG